MPAQPPKPAPVRTRVLVRPTPDIDDLFFYELVQSHVAQKKTPPAYGTAHPDIDTYPNHVLVYVTPHEDDEPGWQRWYYAAERANQDDYNFELDGEGTLTRTYVVPRADYLDGTFVAPSIGTADSVFTDYDFVSQDVKRIGQQELDSYFVLIVQTFSNPDEQLAVSEEGTQQGEKSSETTLGGTAAAQTVTGVTLARTSRQDELGRWENTHEVLSIREGVYGTQVDKMPGYSRVATQEYSAAEPTGATGELRYQSRLATVDVAGNDALWEATRETTQANTAQGAEVSRELGGGIATVDYTRVPEGSAPDTGLLILDSNVVPFGDGNSLKTTKTLDAYPTLVEHRWDEATRKILVITKDVVTPGTATGAFSAGNITEIQPVDKWRSIQINTQYLSSPLGSTETLPIRESYPYPPELTDVQFLSTYAWASAADDYAYAEDLAPIIKVTEPKQMNLKGRLLRIISADPDTTITAGGYDSVFTANLKSWTIGYVASWYHWYIYGDQGRASAYAQVRTWQTPPAICSGITITAPVTGTGGSGVTVDGEWTTSIPATGSPPFPTGWTTVDVAVERAALGYYMVVVKQLYFV